MTAVSSREYRRSKSAQSQRSEYSSSVSTRSKPEEFHTKGSDTPSLRNIAAASRMKGRYGVGDTRFQFSTLSRRARSRMIAASSSTDLSSPSPRQLHGEFWQYRHFIVHREKNIHPLPRLPVSGGSSPKCGPHLKRRTPSFAPQNPGVPSALKRSARQRRGHSSQKFIY